MTKLKRDNKALIKDLELQIDYLVGYAPQGNHWKQEYYLRKRLIDDTLCAEETPQEIRDKINRIQDSIYKLRNNIVNNQDYVQETMEDYAQKHSVRVRDMQGKITYFEL